MKSYIPKNPEQSIEYLEEDLALLEEGLPSEEQLNKLKAKKWKSLNRQCSKIDCHLLNLRLECGSTMLNVIQEEHVLGLAERFEKAIDHLLLHAKTCPNDLYRKISYYGVLIRCRTHSILRLQKIEARIEKLGDDPFGLLDGESPFDAG